MARHFNNFLHSISIGGFITTFTLEMGSFYSQERNTIDSISREYTREIQPLERKAQYICGRWGKNKCSNLEEMRPFLEEYARLRVLEKTNKEIPKHRQHDYEIVDSYRKEGMTFWKYVSDRKFYLTTLDYPGRYEKLNFSKFHWALYMTNAFCAEPPGNEGNEPSTYQRVICDERDQAEVETFRKSWLEIATAIQKKTHEPKPWWRLWR